MLKALIKKVKEKKPLDRLDDEFIKEHILTYFKKNSVKRKLEKYKTEKELLRSKAFKDVVKGVRSELNKAYGVFWLKEGNKLESHASTKERAKIYLQLYKKIFEITGVPKSILDLSCGLNPISYPSMKGFKGQYTATELTKKDCEEIEKIFKKLKIEGKVVQLDLLQRKPPPKAELSLLFKILDILDVKGHISSEALLKRIPSKKLVVSFSTHDLKGKKMNYPRRGWFERMCTRLKWEYKKLEFENEIFYIVTKN